MDIVFGVIVGVGILAFVGFQVYGIVKDVKKAKQNKINKGGNK